MLDINELQVKGEEPYLSSLAGGIPVVVLTAETNPMKGFFASRGEQGPFIMAPEEWRDLSEETLRFIMAHEQGHLVHKDWATNSRMLEKGISQLNTAKLLFWHEFRADEFAAQTVGRKSALRSLNKVTNWIQPPNLVGKAAIMAEVGVRLVALLSGSRRWKKFVMHAAFWGSRLPKT